LLIIKNIILINIFSNYIINYDKLTLLVKPSINTSIQSTFYKPTDLAVVAGITRKTRAREINPDART